MNTEMMDGFFTARSQPDMELQLHEDFLRKSPVSVKQHSSSLYYCMYTQFLSLQKHRLRMSSFHSFPGVASCTGRSQGLVFCSKNPPISNPVWASGDNTRPLAFRFSNFRTWTNVFFPTPIYIQTSSNFKELKHFVNKYSCLSLLSIPCGINNHGGKRKTAIPIRGRSSGTLTRSTA